MKKIGFVRYMFRSVVDLILTVVYMFFVVMGVMHVAMGSEAGWFLIVTGGSICLVNFVASYVRWRKL